MVRQNSKKKETVNSKKPMPAGVETIRPSVFMFPVGNLQLQVAFVLYCLNVEEKCLIDNTSVAELCERTIKGVNSFPRCQI